VNQPSVLLKAAAIAGSVLLAGCFVSYRAGAFRWLTSSRERPAAETGLPSLGEDASDAMFGSSKSDIMIRSGTVPAPAGTTEDLSIMYSSKSGPAFTPGTAPPAPAQSTAPPSEKKGRQP
jgi:hypothetical protein